MKKSTAFFIGVLVLLALIAFYFCVYKKPETFSFGDFWSDVSDGFKTAGDDTGNAFVQSATIVGGALQKAWKTSVNWIGVQGQNASNNLATFSPTQIYQGGDTAISLLTTIAYDTELVIEDVGTDDLGTGFGLIQSSLSPYISQPSTRESPLGGIPGWEDYLQSCSLNIMGVS